MNLRNELVDVLHHNLSGEFDKEIINRMIEKPKFENMGDLAFPCFELAKVLRKSPQSIALELSKQLQSPLFEKAEAINGYLNVFYNKDYVTTIVIQQILNQKGQYGCSNLGDHKVMTIDFSSPNIAKPFSMGHLRSTVIGNSLALIAEKVGYRPIRINHLGDWGTQFGKLMVAYKLWGNQELLTKQPIKQLLNLYVKFHEEAEKDCKLENLAREWFKKLEDGDQEAIHLWKWFRDESLKEFSRIYELLGIEFDSYCGEAFYNNKMDHVVQLLEEQKLIEQSEGAQVVKLEEDLPPCLIKKSDGTTLYATRDLAAALYRQETYQFAKSLYVVGNEQNLHFKQVFAVLEKMGYTWTEGMIHVPFGMMLKDGKKMSTRKGKVVLLEEVLYDAISLALEEIKKKNPALLLKDKVAREVGVGAVIFHDLKNFRKNDIDFSLEDMLKFEGETGPYVQYAHARASSLLRKGEYEEEHGAICIKDKEAWNIIIHLHSFPVVVQKSYQEYDPSQIAKYLINLSKSFNKYYSSVRILENDHLKQQRLTLVYTIKIVLNEGLRLLGIQTPNEM
ncbi:arginine--tRNA ligase [Bacillus pinisoli]|uniref:arginine--tRNA ligase n=1 Tax=Bacillus pinisoli TaxID=2901866 RepID=UPI001FF5BFA9|nr:arginine--tRNA ligase [Bacillus pinisoli]